MKYRLWYCALLWVALCLPATAQAEANFVAGKLWQDQVEVYDKPNGTVICVLSEESDPRRQVSVSGQSVQGWLPVSTTGAFNPMDIVHGYVPAHSVVAYTKDDAPLYNTKDRDALLKTFQKNYAFYFLDYDESISIKGRISDGNEEWVGWMQDDNLTTEPQE